MQGSAIMLVVGIVCAVDAVDVVYAPYPPSAPAVTWLDLAWLRVAWRGVESESEVEHETE